MYTLPLNKLRKKLTLLLVLLLGLAGPGSADAQQDDDDILLMLMPTISAIQESRAIRAIDALYDLSSFEIPFAVNWPIAPRTIQTIHE